MNIQIIDKSTNSREVSFSAEGITGVAYIDVNSWYYENEHFHIEEIVFFDSEYSSVSVPCHTQSQAIKVINKVMQLDADIMDDVRDRYPDYSIVEDWKEYNHGYGRISASRF